MKRTLFTLVLLWLTTMAAVGQVGDLPRSTPAAQGIEPQALARFIEALMAVPETDIHHVMVARHGHVVAEMHPAPFRAQDGHTLYSASKTFASMAVGIAIDENRLRLTDRVATFFPEQLPDTITARLAQMTVADLLTMRSGVKPDWTMRNNESDWVRSWLAKPVDDEPGTRFQYDSMCTFMLSAIVQRVTGRTMLDYLNEYLFGPMHITQAGWEQSPDGINTGGWGLHLQAESQLKLGLLLLNGGKWQGRQLVPAEWVAEAITPCADLHPGETPTEGNQGYGYQIWASKWPGSYRADGAMGQYIVCVPSADLVVVINQASAHGHDVLGCIWNHLMPGVSNGEPLNATARQQRQLERLCATAELPTRVKHGKKLPFTGEVTLGDNRLDIKSILIDGSTISFTYTDGRTEPMTLGREQWAYTRLQGNPPYSIKALNRFGGLHGPFHVATRCGWSADGVWTVTLRYVDWINGITLAFDTAAGTITINDNCDRTHPQTVRYEFK
ncbi:MAG: serine hydrolase [Muribaculaceae bacterium]|nr:serine hydrolase [Muribaculaceae bacterium]